MQGARLVLRARAFLVEDVHQAPFALRALRLGGLEIIAGEVDDLGGRVFGPVAEQGEAKFAVHEPLDFEVLLGAGGAGSLLIETIVEVGVVGVVLAPFEAEFAFGEDAGVGPAIAHGLEPVSQVFVVADGGFPDGCDEAETVGGDAAVEVNGGRIHHFFAAGDGAHVAYGLDGADADAAVEVAFEAVAAGGEEVAGPAIEADAIDEISGTLGWLEVVFTAGVVGVADAAVAVAVVDAVLAPDLALADVNAFVSGEEALIFRIHESGDEGLGAITAAD